MTIKIPPDNILDKILKFLGKERKIVFSEGTKQFKNNLGPHVTIMAKKDSFWKVLFSNKKE